MALHKADCLEINRAQDCTHTLKSRLPLNKPMADFNYRTNERINTVQDLDFMGDPTKIRALVHALRLRHGITENPEFASETALIDPLPHQQIAVYEHMLQQDPLRFLLADDAGAGKTIMTGLYIRTQLMRHRLKRILIVPPAGLVGNWQRELEYLFQLHFRIVEGSSTQQGNPFVGAGSDHVIVSLDALAGRTLFARLQAPEVEPYDLAVFDEAHKLSVQLRRDGQMKRTRRYRLAETLAGVASMPERWHLNWSVRNLLLLTATPHMGRDDAYYGLWRLLLPDTLRTPEDFAQFSLAERQPHFIRRTKEELVDYEGNQLFPMRRCDTAGFALSLPEKELYDRTTDYIQTSYNAAAFLNPEAARLTLGVFQRRLASSSYALMCSLERRCAKLQELIRQAQSGSVKLPAASTPDQDLYDQATAEEYTEAELQRQEDQLVEQVTLTSLQELQTEYREVQALADMARALYQDNAETKFARLRQILPTEDDDKIIVFTEHRDTLNYLMARLEALGYTQKVVAIHGGLSHRERDACIRQFRTPGQQGGADILVATDAAGEGINLQFCWRMVNYDVPWNPARLEQRMGRIHRYGQKSDHVQILNLIATNTREGVVVQRLLEKLDAIRRELGNDKVFNVIGRLFQERPLHRLLFDLAITSHDVSLPEVDTARMQEIAAEEHQRLGQPATYFDSLPDLRRQKEMARYRHLLPARTLQFLDSAGRALGFTLRHNQDQQHFSFQIQADHALNPALARQLSASRRPFTAYRPDFWDELTWLRPGETILEELIDRVLEVGQREGHRGAMLRDARAQKATLMYLALTSVIEKPVPDPEPRLDEDTPDGPDRILAQQLLCLQQDAANTLENCSVDALLDLDIVADPVPGNWDIAMHSFDLQRDAEEYLRTVIAADMAHKWRQRRHDEGQAQSKLKTERANHQLARLLRQRKGLRKKTGEKARAERERMQQDIALVHQHRNNLHAASAKRASWDDRIMPGEPQIWVNVLVVPALPQEPLPPPAPSIAEVDSERIAMQRAIEHEHDQGCKVHDVSTPDRARAAGLDQDWPGFDLWSELPDGSHRCIEVKGRTGEGTVEITSNEWAAAFNLGDRYWLYVVFHCETDDPKLHRVQDPIGSLQEGAISHIRIDSQAIIHAGRPAP